MQPGPPRGRRARPVADAPIDTLLARGEDLAKGWLLTLLERVPLQEAQELLAGELARDGPRLCDAIVRALAADADLHRIEAGGALEPLAATAGVLAGARGPEATSRAADALHAVLWSAVREELTDSDADHVSALSERLRLVIETVRTAALRQDSRGGADPAQSPPQGPIAVATRAAHRPPPGAAEAEPSTNTALWMGPVEDEIAQARASGRPLSLLLVELDDSDRLRAAEAGQVSVTFGRFARALRGVMGRRDMLACETDTRAWIIARDTGRPEAQALGERIATAVAEADSRFGAPLRASVGVAVLRENGHDGPALIAVAEEARFAAAASGVPIIAGRPGSGVG